MNSMVELGALVCCASWLVAYALMIRQAEIDRVPAMPLVPLSLNLAWELVFGFVLPDPTFPMAWINRAWFVVDLVLVAQMLRFGRAEMTTLVPRSWFVPAVLTSIALALAAILTFTLDVEDWGGSYTGWGDQAVNSIAFLFMLTRRRSSRGQSLYIVLFRSLGTLPLIPFELTVSPDSLFIRFTFVAFVLVDAIYAVLLHRQCVAEGRDPWALRATTPALATVAPAPARPSLAAP